MFSQKLPTMFEAKRNLQSTLLLQKKKEMHQVQLQLEKKRLEFAKRMEECREKQEELRAKVSLLTRHHRLQFRVTYNPSKNLAKTNQRSSHQI
jgi:predicted ribosome quality control (RQC) complex YloA/Tae2 family protein